MQSKLGRNDPCWCGSGKKFKKCHLDREAKEKPTVAESLIALKGAYRARDCACPPDMKSDCVGKPIQSHTIAKSLGLNDIAEDGHVFVLQHDFSTLSRTGGKAAFGDKGVNRASVFPGFCTYHDSKLFAPIETRAFSGAPDQCALLSYRALARERFTKMAGIDVNEFIKGADKGRPMEWQLALQHFAATYGEGLSAALRDLEVAMRGHYEAVVNDNFAAFESAVFEFEQEFPLLCTTGYFPSEDWTGKTIQDLANLKLEAAWLTAVSFISDGCSFVVFTWARDHSELMKAFVHEMAEIYKGREADALMKFFFTISDNLAVRPSWWKSLENGRRKALESRVMDGVPLARRAGDDILRPKEGEPLVVVNRLKRFALA